MSTPTQADRPLSITTPLGKDAVFLTELKGHEAISELFRFDLKVLSELKKPVAFDKVLGQPATVEIVLQDGKKRHIDGIVCGMKQGRRDETFFHYELQLVPKLWLLTLRHQSRIFQRLTVPEILKKVLAGLDVKYDLSAPYEPRDYCAQYRESDFAFASRLMEEEGIRYYFEHSPGSHVMVLCDEATKHPDVPLQPEVAYEELPPGGKIEEMRVTYWEKAQEIRPHLYTLRDHCFELPEQPLEAQQPTLDSVPVGKVAHKLGLLGNEKLEVYDFPGGYAQRFDGIDASGGERPAELKKIFVDKERTVRLRMEREETATLRASGTSYCPHFVPGHAFTLKKHFNADGRYAITRSEHEASLEGDYLTGSDAPFKYANRFECIPAALPYRPERKTPRPVISGNQTATVVTPPGEELFCDKYGRVKVQFHWDREGKKDPGSSCWIRVAQPWAGKGWGAFFWPRAGNEVVVSFEEGDPDQPLVVGSVYNADNMPPFKLPFRNELAGIKSASLRGQYNKHFNGVVFCDEAGREHLALHSERNLAFHTELDCKFAAGRNRHEGVPAVSMMSVGCLPGGGGSGGGPADPTTEERLQALEDNLNYSPFGDVNSPSGTMGLYQYMTYGEYMSAVAGLQASMILGSNLGITVNPSALTRSGGTVPPWLNMALGAGIGANTGITMGTSNSFTLGKAVDAKYKDNTKEIDLNRHTATKILAAILAAVILLWMILYATATSIEARTIEFAVFQPIIGVVIVAMLLIEEYYDAWKVGKLDAKLIAFRVKAGKKIWAKKADIAAGAILLGMFAVPIGAAAIAGAVAGTQR